MIWFVFVLIVVFKWHGASHISAEGHDFCQHILDWIEANADKIPVMSHLGWQSNTKRKRFSISFIWPFVQSQLRDVAISSTRKKVSPQ